MNKIKTIILRVKEYIRVVQGIFRIFRVNEIIWVGKHVDFQKHSSNKTVSIKGVQTTKSQVCIALYLYSWSRFKVGCPSIKEQQINHHTAPCSFLCMDTWPRPKHTISPESSSTIPSRDATRKPQSSMYTPESAEVFKNDFTCFTTPASAESKNMKESDLDPRCSTFCSFRRHLPRLKPPQKAHKA